jgi:metal-responsive CopG/Arc/MetJ family transcriptional regulator
MIIYMEDAAMRTVQMTLDAELVVAVDKAARRLGTTRSAFARDALRAALRRVHDKALEEKQREGYRRRPVKRGEFSEWEKEQVWID